MEVHLLDRFMVDDIWQSRNCQTSLALRHLGNIGSGDLCTILIEVDGYDRAFGGRVEGQDVRGGVRLHLRAGDGSGMRERCIGESGCFI